MGCNVFIALCSNSGSLRLENLLAITQPLVNADGEGGIEARQIAGTLQCSGRRLNQQHIILGEATALEKGADGEKGACNQLL